MSNLLTEIQTFLIHLPSHSKAGPHFRHISTQNTRFMNSCWLFSAVQSHTREWLGTTFTTFPVQSYAESKINIQTVRFVFKYTCLVFICLDAGQRKCGILNVIKWENNTRELGNRLWPAAGQECVQISNQERHTSVFMTNIKPILLRT